MQNYLCWERFGQSDPGYFGIDGHALARCRDVLAHADTLSELGGKVEFALLKGAKCLRVIGQSLEAARIATFELEKHDQHYLVSIFSLTEADDLILRHTLRDKDVAPLFCFSPADISRLDAQAQKRRRNQSSSATRLSKMLSHPAPYSGRSA